MNMKKMMNGVIHNFSFLESHRIHSFIGKTTEMMRLACIYISNVNNTAQISHESNEDTDTNSRLFVSLAMTAVENL